MRKNSPASVKYEKRCTQEKTGSFSRPHGVCSKSCVTSATSLSISRPVSSVALLVSAASRGLAAGLRVGKRTLALVACSRVRRPRVWHAAAVALAEYVRVVARLEVGCDAVAVSLHSEERQGWLDTHTQAGTVPTGGFAWGEFYHKQAQNLGRLSYAGKKADIKLSF